MPVAWGAWRLYLFLGLAVGWLAGCSGAPPVAAETANPTTPPATRTWTPRPPTATAQRFELQPSSTPLPPATLAVLLQSGPDNFPEDVNPLTGLKVSDVSILDRRPMVVKITNFPRSVRPQWGLSVADHVYEYYLEDGLTRFVGIFYGRDGERVGPIRSARPFDEHLVRMYKAIFAFGYADDRVFDLWKDSDLRNLLVIERPDNCPPMCRIGPPNAYNTLYTDTHLLSRYITEWGVENGRQNLGGYRFEKDSILLMGGAPATRVETRFSRSSYHYWKYNPLIQKYQRWQDADSRDRGDEDYEPLFDSLNSQQINADNLVILLVPVTYFYHSNSTDIYNIYLQGSGPGYALRDGKIIAITWRREKMSDMLRIYIPGGGLFPFKPGNIWFEVLSDATTHQVSGDTWHFDFAINESESTAPVK